MKKFKLSELQAQAILDMRLQRLTGLERKKIEEEYKELLKAIEKFKRILASESLRKEIIGDELKFLKDKFGDERRTAIVHDVKQMSDEDMMKELIKEEDVVITISNKGFIKRIPVASYKSQGRGGRGITAASTGSTDEDFIEHMVTKLGIIKKTKLDAYSNIRKNGIVALGINKGDELIDVKITNGSQEILIGTHNGQAIRFNESQVRDMGRTATGVKAVKLAKDDFVINLVAVIRQSATILVVTEKGFGKRSA